jgi:hypothetical protein
MRAMRLNPSPASAYDDDDDDALDDVVAHALVVAGWLEGLHVPGGVGRTAGELMLARCRIPLERPTAPGLSTGP